MSDYSLTVEKLCKYSFNFQIFLYRDSAKDIRTTIAKRYDGNGRNLQKMTLPLYSGRDLSSIFYAIYNLLNNSYQDISLTAFSRLYLFSATRF